MREVFLLPSSTLLHKFIWNCVPTPITFESPSMWVCWFLPNNKLCLLSSVWVWRGLFVGKIVFFPQQDQRILGFPMWNGGTKGKAPFWRRWAQRKEGLGFWLTFTPGRLHMRRRPEESSSSGIPRPSNDTAQEGKGVSTIGQSSDCLALCL